MGPKGKTERRATHQEMDWAVVPPRAASHGLGLALALLGLAWGGCAPADQRECLDYQDCPVGFRCDLAAYRCIEDPFATPVAAPAVPALPTPPASEDAARRTIRSSGPVPFLAENPWPEVDGRYLLAEHNEEAELVGEERILAFTPTDFVSAQMRIDQLETALDLGALGLSPCGVDAVFRLDGTAPVETWLSCRRTQETLILYEGYGVDGLVRLPHLSELWTVLPAPQRSDWPRLLVAGRGSDRLRAYRLRRDGGDGVAIGHPEQDQLPTLGGPILGLWPAAPGPLSGSYVIVWTGANAGQPARLNLLERPPRGEAWRLSSAHASLALPAANTWIHVLTTPQAGTQTPTPDRPNLVGIELDTGTLRFWNWETARELPPAVPYESDPAFHAAIGDWTLPPLVASAPGGDVVFVAHPAANRIWRIPLATEGAADVQFIDVEPDSRRFARLIAESRDAVWVTFANDRDVERRAFAALDEN